MRKGWTAQGATGRGHWCGCSSCAFTASPASCSSVHRLSPESQQLLVLSGIARTALSFMLGRNCKTPNERFTVRACSWILKYPLFSCLSNHEGKPTALMPRIVWMIFSNLQQTPFWMHTNCSWYFSSCSSRGTLSVCSVFRPCCLRMAPAPRCLVAHLRNKNRRHNRGSGKRTKVQTNT